MPDAEMITLGLSSKLMALDSSLVMESFKPAKAMGLIPAFTSSMASPSKHSIRLSWKIPVASTARGESTNTWKSSCPSTRRSTLIFLRKNRSSWVLPTAKEGITTFPPASKVSFKILANSPL